MGEALIVWRSDKLNTALARFRSRAVVVSGSFGRGSAHVEQAFEILALGLGRQREAVQVIAAERSAGRLRVRTGPVNARRAGLVVAPLGVLLVVDYHSRVEERGPDVPEDGAQAARREEVVDVDDDFGFLEGEGRAVRAGGLLVVFFGRHGGRLIVVGGVRWEEGQRLREIGDGECDGSKFNDESGVGRSWVGCPRAGLTGCWLSTK